MQALTFSQAVPGGAIESAGQSFDLPEHFSATSQSFTAARQTVPAGSTASPGQSALKPSQNSGRSQAPEAGRQSMPFLEGGY
jgi:hypothetical protein